MKVYYIYLRQYRICRKFVYNILMRKFIYALKNHASQEYDDDNNNNKRERASVYTFATACAVNTHIAFDKIRASALNSIQPDCNVSQSLHMPYLLSISQKLLFIFALGTRRYILASKFFFLKFPRDKDNTYIYKKKVELNNIGFLSTTRSSKIRSLVDHSPLSNCVTYIAPRAVLAERYSRI